MVAAVFIIIPTLGTSYSHIGKYCFPCWEYYIHESSRPRISKYSRKNLVNSRFFRTFASQYLISMRMEKRKGKSGKSLWCLILVLLGIAVKGNAQRNDSVVVAPDSSNFVTASLVIISPTNEVYSVFGHTAIRMECPSHQLDYVFTFESDPSVGGFLTFFAGKAKGYFVAVPTQEFLKDVENKGRGVKQYELNLTLHEEQELWRNLDNDMMEGAHRKFNLLVNNCVSMAVMKLYQSCIDEHLEWDDNTTLTLLNNGDYVRQCVQQSPWASFWFITFMGTVCEDSYDYESRLCPANLIEEMQKASFIDEEKGTKRTVLKGQERTLLPETSNLSQSIITPTVVFGLLLLVVCFMTFAEWRWNWKRPVRYIDVALFILQSLSGLVLLYVTWVSELFGAHWNWYLVPFNPIPLILWLCLRKQKNYGRVYLLYTVVLVAFIALTPFLSQLDLPHQLITTMMAVRCGSKYLEYRYNRK